MGDEEGSKKMKRSIFECSLFRVVVARYFSGLGGGELRNSVLHRMGWSLHQDDHPHLFMLGFRNHELLLCYEASL